MNGDAEWKLNIHAEEAKQETLAKIEEGIREVFELDIKPDAIRESPFKTGTNRRSIDVDVTRTERGIVARLYSQSGYGGFLELGTRFMKAMPYLYPAFNKYVKKLGEVIGAKVRSIKPGMFVGPAEKR